MVKQDSRLDRRVTHWWLHHELTTDPLRAEAWHYFVHRFLPKHSVFTRQDLLDALTARLSEHSVKHFGPGSQLTKTIVRKLLECYTEDYALGSLGVIIASGSGFQRGSAKRQIGPWRSPKELMNAYAKSRN